METVLEYWELIEVKYALFGGFLIGCAATFNFMLLGRITGMSGSLRAITEFKSSFARSLHLSFVAGLICCLYPVYLVSRDGYINVDNEFEIQFLDTQGYLHHPILTPEGYIIAGLLVGLGTALGSGCTSGHGVCGLPRFSKRSWTAVITFMGVGIATGTYLPDHLRFTAKGNFGHTLHA